MSSNSNLISNLRWPKRKEWDHRSPEQRAQDKEAMARLAQSPDLEVFLRWLEWQRDQALSLDFQTTIKWEERALINRGKIELINDIASQLKVQ